MAGPTETKVWCSTAASFRASVGILWTFAPYQSSLRLTIICISTKMTPVATILPLTLEFEEIRESDLSVSGVAERFGVSRSMLPVVATFVSVEVKVCWEWASCESGYWSRG